MNALHPTSLTDVVIKGLEDKENYIIKLKTSNLLKYIPGDVIKASNQEIEYIYLPLPSVDEDELRETVKLIWNEYIEMHNSCGILSEQEQLNKCIAILQPYFSQSEGKKGGGES